MFLPYYKLTSQPFGVTPDPRHLYLSPTHREAMASVFFGVMQNRGFTALIAHPGMGKTTLLFDLQQRIPRFLKTVFLFQTQCNERDLLRNILLDLGVQDAGDDLAAMQGKLNEVFLRETMEGNRVIVLVDEAQNLDDSVLEVLRVLSNFETGQEKLLHIVLAGQPQLAKKLSSPAMVQLRQRISVVARIAPFKAAETRAYIEHRLHIAGYSGVRPLFTNHAYDLIAVHSQGVPRNINNICFNAMAVACALQQKTIRSEVIREVLRDLDLQALFDESPQPEARRMLAPAAEGAPMKANSKPSGPPLARLVLATAAMAVCLLFLLVYGHARASNLAGISARPAAKAVLTNTMPVASAEIGIPVSSVRTVNGGATSLQAGAVDAVPSLAAGSKREVPVDRIESKETLYNLYIRTRDRYYEQVQRSIQKVNLWLSNPERIRIGQSIRMPDRENNLSTKEHVSQSSILEGNKHE